MKNDAYQYFMKDHWICNTLEMIFPLLIYCLFPIVMSIILCRSFTIVPRWKSPCYQPVNALNVTGGFDFGFVDRSKEIKSLYDTCSYNLQKWKGVSSKLIQYRTDVWNWEDTFWYQCFQCQPQQCCRLLKI